MKDSIPRIAALLLAMALGAAACGTSDNSSDAVAETESTQADTSDSGDAAPTSVLDISAPAADGTTINLLDYAGQDLMLWFWAPW